MKVITLPVMLETVPTVKACPYKRDTTHDCQGRRIPPRAICNGFVPDAWFQERCDHYGRMQSLKEQFPQMWKSGGVCCEDYRALFVQCAEESGDLKGALDIRVYPNDGKDTWKNYRRVRFAFCPFCGADLREEDAGSALTSSSER